MANTYSDNALTGPSSPVITIQDSGNANANVSVILKTWSLDKPVKSNFEYDQNGQPYASAHRRDFRKGSISVASLNTANAPAQMVKFSANIDGGGNANYVITGIKCDGGTEVVKSYSADIVEVIA